MNIDISQICELLQVIWNNSPVSEKIVLEYVNEQVKSDDYYLWAAGIKVNGMFLIKSEQASAQEEDLKKLEEDANHELVKAIFSKGIFGLLNQKKRL